MRSYGVLLGLCGSVALRLEPAGPDAPAETCTSGTFGSTPYLEGVQTLSPAARPKSFRGFHSPWPGIFVYPKGEFAMCVMEKNGISTWSVVFARMTGNNKTDRTPEYQVFDQYWDQHWSEEAANAVFHNPQSVRALWIRDPLERFLSAFLNKCTRKRANEYELHCPFSREGLDPGFPLAETQSWLRAGGKLLDGHYSPQSEHCELSRRLHEFSLIGLMAHGGFAKNAECILKQAGFSHLNEDAYGRPFFKTPVNPTMLEANTAAILKKFFTKEFAYELLDLYKHDYDLFRLKRPTWVDEATGEWFNQPARRDMKSKTADFSEAEGDEDDIVYLAERAGFYLE